MILMCDAASSLHQTELILCGSTVLHVSSSVLSQECADPLYAVWLCYAACIRSTKTSCNKVNPEYLDICAWDYKPCSSKRRFHVWISSCVDLLHRIESRWYWSTVLDLLVWWYLRGLSRTKKLNWDWTVWIHCIWYWCVTLLAVCIKLSSSCVDPLCCMSAPLYGVTIVLTHCMLYGCAMLHASTWLWYVGLCGSTVYDIDVWHG
jgi:hypothetical protein